MFRSTHPSKLTVATWQVPLRHAPLSARLVVGGPKVPPPASLLEVQSQLYFHNEWVTFLTSRCVRVHAAYVTDILSTVV